MGVGWVALLVGAHIDWWDSHTGLYKVTDAGLKAFSAALGSSTTITTVTLGGKSECLACSYEWVHAWVCMRVFSVCVCEYGVYVWEVHGEWTLVTSMLLGRGCWVGGAPRGRWY